MKKHWFSVLFGCFAIAISIDALGEQQSELVGHWVNLEFRIDPFLALDIEPDGKVYPLYPQIQGRPPTYILEKGRVLLKGGEGPTGAVPPESFELQGETLLNKGQPIFTRFSGAPRVNDGVRGTWISVSGEAGKGEMFWTFRSDGLMIIEWASETAMLTGNTFKALSSSFTVHQVENYLYVESRGKKSRFVRRPWGCLGLPSLDRPAAECQ